MSPPGAWGGEARAASSQYMHLHTQDILMDMVLYMDISTDVDTLVLG